MIRARSGKGRARAMANGDRLGRKRAKERGVHMGRRAKFATHQKRDALNALTDGTASQADLARRFNVSQSTISRLTDETGQDS